MCTHKLHILTPSRTYRPVLSRLSMDVPCGKCPQCVSQAQDDWFIRIWSEIKKYNDAGGFVVFATQTYSDRYLPHFRKEIINEETGEIKKIDISCFNKHHIRNYIHAIRDYIRYKGVSETILPFHSMVSSEYGEANAYIDDHGNARLGTHRPHYHSLFFFPREVRNAFPKDIDIINLLQKFWIFGRVEYSKCKDGIYVNNEFAGRYVSKYMTKQIEFYNKPELLDFLFDEDGKLIKDRWQEFKPYSPQHWQSQGFGIDLLDYCKDDKVFTDGIDFSFKMDIDKGRRKVYRIPRYIVRKALYELDDKDRLILNDRGVKVFGDRQLFAKKIAKLNSDYIHFFSTSWLDARLTPADISQNFSSELSSTSDLVQEFRNMLGSRSIEELSLYSFTLQHRSCLRNADFLGRIYLKSFQDMNKEDLYKNCFLIYKEALSLIEDSEFKEEGFKDDIRRNERDILRFNDLPRFKGFDSLLQLFEKVKYIYSLKCEQVYNEDRKRRKLVKLKIA